MSNDPSRTNQQAEGNHIAQASEGSTAIVGDDNVVVSGEGIAQVVKAERDVSNVTQIGKVIIQFVDEKVFKRFGLEQRVGFVLVGLLIIGANFILYRALSPRSPDHMIGEFNVAIAEFIVVDEEGALRCLPHRHGCDGFFAVRLDRRAH